MNTIDGLTRYLHKQLQERLPPEYERVVVNYVLEDRSRAAYSQFPKIRIRIELPHEKTAHEEPSIVELQQSVTDEVRSQMRSNEAFTKRWADRCVEKVYHDVKELLTRPPRNPEDVPA